MSVAGDYDDRLEQIKAAQGESRIEQAAAQRARIDAARRAQDTGRGPLTKGVLAMVDVGWTVWARTEGLDARLDADEQARGGVVVEVATTAGHIDDEGEIHPPTRKFRCIDPYYTKALRWTTLAEASVNVDAVEMFNRRQVWRMVAAICDHVGIRSGGRVDVLRHEQHWQELIADAWRLARSTATKGIE